jgi:hypothetical protein
MDNDLLEKAEPAATNRLPLGPNDESHSETETAIETQYRELEVEKPSPPVRLKFDPPIEYDGEKYDQIVCDFDKLIGKDFQRIEREFVHMYKAEKNETVLPELKHLFHCLVIARAADVPVGLIFKLPRRYYTPIRLEALKACGSSPDTEKV